MWSVWTGPVVSRNTTGTLIQLALVADRVCGNLDLEYFTVVMDVDNYSVADVTIM